jgi:hypothetical protein
MVPAPVELRERKRKAIRSIPMCAGKHPNAKAVIDNLRQPLPFWKKIALIIKNTAIKMGKLQSCCGNPGEPGC